MGEKNASRRARLYRPVDEVANVMGNTPEAITAVIQGAAKAFDWLDEIFQMVERAAQDGDLNTIRRMAPMGRQLAEDYANFAHGARSDMLEAMQVVGLDGRPIMSTRAALADMRKGHGD